jgi:hypothetical protein
MKHYHARCANQHAYHLYIDQLFNSNCACTNKCAPIKCNISFIKFRQRDAENDIAEDQYVNYELAKKQIGINISDNNIEKHKKPWFNLSWTKHRISQDEEEIDEAYITAETKQFLEEQRKSKSWSRKLLPWLCKTKVYDDTDKYKERIPNPTEVEELSEDEQTIASVLSHQMEEVRLRLFWKPTKDYDKNDKYAVTLKDSDEVVPPPDTSNPYEHAGKVPVCPWEQETEETGVMEKVRRNSSYESADETVVPYK